MRLSTSHRITSRSSWSAFILHPLLHLEHRQRTLAIPLYIGFSNIVSHPSSLALNQAKHVSYSTEKRSIHSLPYIHHHFHLPVHCVSVSSRLVLISESPSLPSPYNFGQSFFCLFPFSVAQVYVHSFPFVLCISHVCGSHSHRRKNKCKSRCTEVNFFAFS